jgi:hypothetical protein
MPRAAAALARRHPRDADVALLAAEAQLNLHPYDWWDAAGQPLAWTPGIEALLQQSLRLQPRHPAPTTTGSTCRNRRRIRSAAWPAPTRCATHIPARATCCTCLRTSTCGWGAMPRPCGQPALGIAADEHYLQQVDAQGAYRVGYVAHNHHFLWAAACMAGQPQVAQAAAEAAWPAACGPGAARPRPGHHRALRGAARLHPRALRPVAGHAARHPAARRARPLRAGLWHYARGTAHAQLREAEQPAQQELLQAAAVWRPTRRWLA